MTKTIPYLKRVPGRNGYYGQRAIPKRLQAKLRKKTIIRKLGNSLAEARRNLPEFLDQCDALFADAEGVINEGLLNRIDKTPVYGIQEDLQAQGLTPSDIYPRHSIEDANKLADRQANREAGLLYCDRTWSDLIDLGVRLKGPARSTVGEWRRRTAEMVRILVSLTHQR